jgi:enoyl-CoA hydratase/carnithine racemase
MFVPAIHTRGNILLQHSRRALQSTACSTFSALFSTSTQSDDDGPPLLQKLDENGVLTLTLNRPKHRNALNRELLHNLHTSLTSAANSVSDSNTPVKVVVLQSHGYVFSSGHDLKELKALSNDQAAIQNLFELCTETMLAFSSIPQPTICAVEGLATAAGCQLVASCDVVVASSLASFQTPGATLGLFCHTPAVPLARCIGSKQALDMLYTGRELSAKEALTHGLVSRLAKDAQKEAAKIAKEIATESSSATIQMGKRVFFQQQSLPEMGDAYKAATQAMVNNMELYDAKHGIASFLQKQKPDFQDK